MPITIKPAFKILPKTLHAMMIEYEVMPFNKKVLAQWELNLLEQSIDIYEITHNMDHYLVYSNSILEFEIIGNLSRMQIFNTAFIELENI